MDQYAQEPTPAGRPERKERVAAHIRFGVLFVMLSALWLVLSGRTGTQPLIIMVLSVSVVALLNLGRWHRARSFSPIAFLRYVIWMLYSITRANVQVARIVLHPAMPIDPLLLEFRADFQRSGALALLANSITLTPGTVTIDLQQRRYVVHALVPATAEAILRGEVQARVGAVFSEAPQGSPAVRWSRRIEELGG